MAASNKRSRSGSDASCTDVHCNVSTAAEETLTAAVESIGSRDATGVKQTGYESLMDTLRRNCECGKRRVPCYEHLQGEELRATIQRRIDYFKTAEDIAVQNRIYGELSGFYSNPPGCKKGRWTYR
jgi:hypothetical protein